MFYSIFCFIAVLLSAEEIFTWYQLPMATSFSGGTLKYINKPIVHIKMKNSKVNIIKIYEIYVFKFDTNVILIDILRMQTNLKIRLISSTFLYTNFWLLQFIFKTSTYRWYVGKFS